MPLPPESKNGISKHIEGINMNYMLSRSNNPLPGHPHLSYGEPLPVADFAAIDLDHKIRARTNRLEFPDFSIGQLQSVELAGVSHLPEISAVYFAVERNGQVQYIGQTKNLKDRWSRHERYGQLAQKDRVKVFYLPCDYEVLLHVERLMIYEYSPTLNDTTCDRVPGMRPDATAKQNAKPAYKAWGDRSIIFVKWQGANFASMGKECFEEKTGLPFEKLRGCRVDMPYIRRLSEVFDCPVSGLISYHRQDRENFKPSQPETLKAKPNFRKKPDPLLPSRSFIEKQKGAIAQ
jgi:hypothetical protein